MAVGVKRADGEGRRRTRDLDRGLEALAADGRDRGERVRRVPASTRHLATSVAPFQLAYTIAFDASVRVTAAAGAVFGFAFHGKR